MRAAPAEAPFSLFVTPAAKCVEYTGRSMLTFTELPPYLEQLDHESRALGSSIAHSLGARTTALLLLANRDATHAEEERLVYVASGLLKWCTGAKLVRLYNEGDWLSASPHGAGHGASATSEFATHLKVVSRHSFEEALDRDQALSERWRRYKDLQEQILLGLLGVLSTEEVAPNTRLARFQEGEVIVVEGSAADEVFVMLEGSATVQIGGQPIGAVAAGEVFGEMSFLTNGVRSATVMARETCLVQVIERDNFALMIRSNPALIAHMATTLAKRVLEGNRKLHTG